ncbi:hypothetical protein NDU88_001842 [Pleurodeles waltl]|uniref:Secreted protein n=1 Tax=Pleurodeles waltl TaxID=8319 RepID=A0AAV7VXX7_PLEWA|nr:hypothetical protein NDU88_001842 [Pleurodeles waltl]
MTALRVPVYSLVFLACRYGLGQSEITVLKSTAHAQWKAQCTAVEPVPQAPNHRLTSRAGRRLVLLWASSPDHLPGKSSLIACAL